MRRVARVPLSVSRGANSIWNQEVDSRKLKVEREKITQRARRARRRSIRFSESTMNRKEEEAMSFTTEFAESAEKEFGAEFVGEEVDSRKLKVEREAGGRREGRKAAARLPFDSARDKPRSREASRLSRESTCVLPACHFGSDAGSGSRA